MIKFIHLADVHLGLQLNKLALNIDLADERRKALWSSFESTINYAQDNKYDFVFIAGDLYEEEYFTLGDIRRVRDIFSYAKDVNILISAGNHDYLHKKSAYKLIDWPSNVHIFPSNHISKKEFPDKDISVFGYSWDRKEIYDDKIFDQADFTTDCKNKILLIHGDLFNESNYLPLNKEKLLNLEMDYIALGHIHKAEIIANKIAYPGKLEATDFGESGEKGYIRGSLNGSLELDFIKSAQRNFRIEEIKINEKMTYNDIKNLFLNLDRIDKDFYRIKLKGYIQNDINKNDLFKDIKDSFYYLEIEDLTIPDYDLQALEEDFKGGIIGEFISLMKKDNLEDPVVKDALYIGLEALLKERINK